MGFFNPGFVLFIFLFSLINLLITIQYTTTQPSHRFHFCYGDNYTTGSTFQTNLNRLLPSLSSANNSIKNGYYNATFGQNPDTVYGSFQCRGNISLEDCQGCVKMGAEEIKENDRCPISKEAIIWYDECMLRYSNEYYFNIMQESPAAYLWNPNNVSNPEQFRQNVSDFLKRLTREVQSNDDSTSIKFASGDININDFAKVYGLVQCTEDISISSCNRCLLGAISELPNCCDGKRGGRVLRPSCNFRFESAPFFESTVTPSPPPLASPPPPPPPPSSITDTPNSNGNNTSKLLISIVVPSAVAGLFAIAFWFFCFWRKKTKTKKLNDVDDEIPSTESLQFNFSTVIAATDNFSEANKLGEGGFGSVYKGTLPDGREIAVKRLSKYSGQGDLEFKNEVTLVAKLQHRNLMQLIGFSLAGEEKLLIYEFMPNGSLDRFLFDPIRCTQLDWERRYEIIGGVARGLLYLHEESRLKIIHRDLKASNILLDMDMNPKIADFGMARIFVLDQTQERTSRIVGTYGYMAPEYIMHGRFSVKSDVFSFGVLVLEILSGQKTSSFHQSDIAQDLLSYVWRHWNDGSAIEILDPTLKDTCSRNEALRCIHVALLCVQENVADRPSMPTVILMLSSYSASIPALPSAPAFFAGRSSKNEISSSSKNESISEPGRWSTKLNVHNWTGKTIQDNRRVARGLVYLHEESRLKVVHRDLKASNILLDSEMNPKIADFGMARLFGLDQIQDNTNRIVGTYGYMAPEYIMHGEFSVKSDVYSFGVLVLEILCGRKNSSFHKSDIARDLLSYAWRHWNNETAIEILDPILKDTCSGKEAVRCIHVALLCVQENAEDRPSMPTVVQMLNSYAATNPIYLWHLHFCW
ncbi:hypothetical protein MKW92_048525 [Papaver armeniacum]|nr:hypothetical protein MKW92_048525 [Papaver armeniacum]